MGTYLITGPNGSGKSTVFKELIRRGYYAIETDFESGISGWFDNKTQRRTESFPAHPFSKRWLDAHSWLWDAERITELITKNSAEHIFFAGGAYNQHDLYHLFDKHFTLFTDDETLTMRLQARGEGDRWLDASPELAKMLAWNKKSKQHALDSGGIVIDSGRPIKIITDEILEKI